MITRDDLEGLARREARPESPVLSVYLDTDQSRAANINRGFEAELKARLRQIEQQLDGEELKEFGADAGRIIRFIEDYREPKRGLVIFCDASEDFFWMRALNVRVRSGVWWGEMPYLRPLFETIDEYERYGLVLTDRAHARLFTIFLGEIEEHKEAFAEAEVTRIKAPGTERARSQMNLQRKADEHARWHLKRVAEMAARLAQSHAFDRLILAGPVEATTELYGLLSKRLRARVARRLSLPVEASEQRVLEETLKVEEEIARGREAQLVEELITAASKRERAVLGIDATLLALQEGRIWQLIYADGFAPHGGECTGCGTLVAEEQDACAYCGAKARAVADLIERAAERVFDLGGKVEDVRGPAAARLQEAGSVGAFLHF
jgi:peptide subunit release factor 1 (eRF1)